MNKRQKVRENKSKEGYSRAAAALQYQDGEKGMAIFINYIAVIS